METENRPKTDGNVHMGHNLRRLRQMKGLTLEKMENLVEMSQKSIVEIEKTKKLDDEMLEKFAQALEVSVETIKEMKEETSPIVMENHDNTYNNDTHNEPQDNASGNIHITEGITENSDTHFEHSPESPSMLTIAKAFSLMLKQEREENASLKNRIEALENKLKEEEDKNKEEEK